DLATNLGESGAGDRCKATTGAIDSAPNRHSPAELLAEYQSLHRGVSGGAGNSANADGGRSGPAGQNCGANAGEDGSGAADQLFEDVLGPAPDFAPGGRLFGSFQKLIHLCLGFVGNFWIFVFDLLEQRVS